MEAWSMNFLPSIFIMILFSIIPMAIGMVVLYFVIKLAVKNGIKEYEESKLK